MKTTLLILTILASTLLGLDLIFWVLAHASGHKIPAKTDWGIGLFAFVMILAVIFLQVISSKRKRK